MPQEPSRLPNEIMPDLQSPLRPQNAYRRLLRWRLPHLAESPRTRTEVRRSDSEFEARPIRLQSLKPSGALWIRAKRFSPTTTQLERSSLLSTRSSRAGNRGPTASGFSRTLRSGTDYWAHASSPAATRCAGPKGLQFSPRISVVDRAPPGGLEALTEIELHRTYAATQERLWRCTWIPLGPDRHWIILALHHAVADGISSLVIVRDLLATCSALVGVGELPQDLPVAGR